MKMHDHPFLTVLIAAACACGSAPGAEKHAPAAATCSSQYSADHGPARAVDGGLKTNWVAKRLPCSVQIDLGRTHKVGKIVWNSDRGSGYALRTPTAYRFLVSTTGAFAGEEKVVVAEEGNRDGATVTHVIEPATARYVRMEITATPGPRHLQPSVDEVWLYPPAPRKARGPLKQLERVAVRFTEFRPDSVRHGRGFRPTRSRGTLYVYFRNERTTALDVADFCLDGVPFKELEASRRVTWWQVRPNPVPAGATAQLAAHVRGVADGDVLRTRLALADGAGELEADVAVGPQPVWVDFVGFDQSLREMYLYVRASGDGQAFKRLLLSGEDVSSRVRWAAPRFGKSVTSGVVTLGQPLEQGQTAVIELETPRSQTGFAVRAFPSVFPFLLCTQKPPTDADLVAIKQHCHSGVMAGINTIFARSGLSLGESTASQYGDAVAGQLERVFRHGLDFAFYGHYTGHAAQAIIGEIAVYRVDGAKCSPVASATKAANSGYGTKPESVLDGKPETKWVAGSAETWIQLDLGRQEILGRLVWSGSRETYRLRIPSDYDILGSPTGQFEGEGQTLASVRGNTANWRVEAKLRPASVRYIRMAIHRTYPSFECRPAGLSRDVLAWLKDEPDSGLADRRVSPQAIVRMAERSSREIPRVRFGTRACTPDTEDYNQQADVLGTGPVWHPSRRPTWSVLAVRYHDVSGAKHDARRPGWLLARPPTPTEARIQAYSAVAEGAKGLWYWHYGSFTWGRAAEGKGVEGVRQIGLDDPRNADLWREIARVGAELRAVGPYLARADMGAPLPSNDPGLEATLFRSGVDTNIVALLNIRERDGHLMRTQDLYAGAYIAREKLKGGAPATELAARRGLDLEVPVPVGDAVLSAAAVRCQGLQAIPFERGDHSIRLSIPSLDTALVVLVTTRPEVVTHVEGSLAASLADLRAIGALGE